MGDRAALVMPDEPRRCYYPRCPVMPRWHVTDTSDENASDACGEHMPRLVDRKMRRLDGEPLVVSPLFVPELDDVAMLLSIGASVYGLVSDPSLARQVDELMPGTRELIAEVNAAGNDALRRAGRGPVVDVKALAGIRRRKRLAAPFWRLYYRVRRWPWTYHEDDAR